MTTLTADQGTSIESIARVAHEANRAYCQSIGDDSQLPWGEAPTWQRDSAIDGVRSVVDGTSQTPEESHENWLALKESEGWVYGPVKDPEATPPTHPCMVPYDALPNTQKTKDALFLAVVSALLAGGARPSTPRL